MPYVYTYTTRDDLPASACPWCGQDWTNDGGISLDLVLAGKPIDDVPTKLDEDGTLLDTPDHAVGHGYHCLTKCGGCWRPLIDMDAVQENLQEHEDARV